MGDSQIYINIFTNNLRRLMEEYGKSQKDVADAIGVSKQTFNKWILGKSLPRMDKVDALAKYFKVNRSDLLESNATQKEDYYLNPETRELAEFLFNNPKYKVLFSAARDVPPEDLEFVRDLLDRFKK